MGKQTEIQALPPLTGVYLSHYEEWKRAQSHKASFPPAFSTEKWMEDKCLYYHKISFSKANELRCFKSKSKLTPKLLILKLPGDLHAFLSSSKALVNSSLLSVPFLSGAELWQGCEPCRRRLCGRRGCCGHARRPPGHPDPAGTRAPTDLPSGCWAPTFQSSRIALPPLPRIRKECAVSVFKMQI